ncbi:rhomboid family intramembrane serine protease [Flavobacterium terrisoli]|uniref:rhomboid family intramembrane serine protease n=1 Tax=Flavobacterium terrisoli TaxID=3242195 RepID=UPI002542A914|nr:rhomboid family intramembrane serine protease [Flavobacterium buctense]
MNLLQDLKFQYKIGDVGVRLVFWNLLFFAVPEIVFAVIKLLNIHIDYLSFVSLSTNFGDLTWKPWSILSYAFFHFGIIHLIFNMLMLHYTSRLFLTFFTQKQLLGAYILGAIFSGLIFLLGYNYLPALSQVQTSMVGASGAIMAILLATTTYQPFMDVRLMFFGKVKLWQITIVLLFLDLIQLPMNNTGGHIAHLSGAFFGYIYIKLLQNGTDLSKIVTGIINFFADLFSTKKATPFKKVHVNPKKPAVKKESKIVAKDKTQQQIDEILDKISQSGYDSLTAEEKEFLFKAGK